MIRISLSAIELKIASMNYQTKLTLFLISARQYSITSYHVNLKIGSEVNPDIPLNWRLVLKYLAVRTGQCVIFANPTIFMKIRATVRCLANLFVVVCVTPASRLPAQTVFWFSLSLYQKSCHLPLFLSQSTCHGRDRSRKSHDSW